MEGAGGTVEEKGVDGSEDGEAGAEEAGGELGGGP